MKIRAIITGASGMVGEGVLQEALSNPDVEAVLVVGRKPCGYTHPKLKEILHANFLDVTTIAEQLKVYNACYFCLGVSSVGISKEDYYKMTYTLTMHFAGVVAKQNPDLTFCYVSGTGTSNDINKGQNWARVKGKTEQNLAQLPFKAVYNFRPGFMKPTEGAKNVLPAFKYFGWLYPVVRAVGLATTIKEVGHAMINATQQGYPKQSIEINDIKVLAKK